MCLARLKSGMRLDFDNNDGGTWPFPHHTDACTQRLLTCAPQTFLWWWWRAIERERERDGGLINSEGQVSGTAGGSLRSFSPPNLSFPLQNNFFLQSPLTPRLLVPPLAPNGKHQDVCVWLRERETRAVGRVSPRLVSSHPPARPDAKPSFSTHTQPQSSSEVTLEFWLRDFNSSFSTALHMAFLWGWEHFWWTWPAIWLLSYWKGQS